MLGIATFSALLPTMQAEWSLSNADAGWITGIYFAGYVVAAPVLTSLTDRVDAREPLVHGDRESPILVESDCCDPGEAIGEQLRCAGLELANPPHRDCHDGRAFD